MIRPEFRAANPAQAKPAGVGRPNKSAPSQKGAELRRHKDTAVS